MYINKNIKNALSEEVTVASVVAKHLGLKSNFFSQNKNSKILKQNFELFKVEGIIHLRLPSELRRYIADFNAVVMLDDEDETEFDYVVPLNANNKIGFWK